MVTDVFGGQIPPLSSQTSFFLRLGLSGTSEEDLLRNLGAAVGRLDSGLGACLRDTRSRQGFLRDPQLSTGPWQHFTDVMCWVWQRGQRYRGGCSQLCLIVSPFHGCRRAS